MAHFKQGVDPYTLAIPCQYARMEVERVYGRSGVKLTITSTGDGKHGPTSKHYIGLAFDCRTSVAGISQTEAATLATKIRPRIPQFDVVVESDHIHVEYDPQD